MNNNETYLNLNTVTLYKTPLFSQTDSVLFESESDRDSYFDSISNVNKLEMTEFTDLYEGRNIILPINYIEAKKKYNTMKLCYNDGLGHTETYYCNVDNFLYVSPTDCLPIYRIDYFLTYGHLLYNKEIDLITTRRTVREDEVNTMMKADSIVVPKLHYEKKQTWFNPNNVYPEKEYYVIFLNNTTNQSAKKGIKVNFYLPLGKDSSNNYVNKKIDDYTIGCYIALCNPEYLNEFLTNEPAEYIEKIIQTNVPESRYKQSLVNQHYVYVTSDIDLDDFQYFKIASKNDKIIKSQLLNLFPDVYTNLYPNSNKKVMEWLPTKGFVVQGQEFDLKDFDDELFPTDENVDVTFVQNESTLYFYNCFGYTFCFPIGYRGEPINLDFMLKWQSAKNFSYVNDYQNSLAYKQIQEENNQSIINAQRTAGVQSYYANLMAQNANAQLDITKSLTTASYLSQENSMSSSYFQTNAGLENQIYNIRTNQATRGTDLKSWILNPVKTYSTGAVDTQVNVPYLQSLIDNNNQTLNTQKEILAIQRDFNYKNIELQKQANLISAQFQCDTASITRDNAISMISIKNKYNNCKPGAYYQTDYTQYTSYYYLMTIETFNDTNFSMVDNIRNHYNVCGIDVGYIEKWKPSERKGLYFNYVLGSILDNSNKLISQIPSEIFIELSSRIEQGIRLWYKDQLYWFGNLTIDNTYTGSPMPHYNLSDESKAEIEEYINDNIWSYSKEDLLSMCYSRFFSLNERSYVDWIINDLPYGESVSNDKKLALNAFFYSEETGYLPTKEEAITYVKNIMNNLTVYEKQYCLDTAIPLVYDN